MRGVIALLCFTSIGALLAQVFGVAAMHTIGLWATLPAMLILIGLGLRGNEAIAIGVWGGVLGTLGYDAFRVPFMWAGYRVFAPISAYGVWLLDARHSDRWTESMGWLYHCSNGLTFGVLYALLARNRYWAWGVVWGCALETFAILCPFGALFHLRGNLAGLTIAYGGHVAYGVPLGLVVQHWEATRDWLQSVPKGMLAFGWALLLAGVAQPLLSGTQRARDSQVVPDTLLAEKRRLNPDWVRIRQGESVHLKNPLPERAEITVRGRPCLTLGGSGEARLDSLEAGIHQVTLAVPGRSLSSFVLVEPP